MTADGSTATGQVTWELRGPDGRVKDSGATSNLITQEGDRTYWERGAGVTGAPAAPTGMKLGTGSTAVAKTGAGAALTTYLTNSHLAFDATFPSSALNGAARRVTYRCTFAAGKATSASPITEAVIVNEALTDATSAAAATVHRVLLSPAVAAKGAGDSLVLTWTSDLTS